MALDLEPLDSVRRADGVFEQLRSRILSGAFPAGERLPNERDLAAALRVNRGSVREAVKRLEFLELVERIRRGAIALRRTGAASERRALAATIDAVDPPQAEALIRAFGLYFQLANLATANYGFFVYLALALHLFLLDDADVAPIVRRLPGRKPRATPRLHGPEGLRRGLAIGVSAVYVAISSMQALAAFAQDYTRAVLGVPGMNYSTLLLRSVDFNRYLVLLTFSYLDRKLDPLMFALAVIGIVYGAWVSTVQPDHKKLVAYSSVSHLGFVVLGIFSLNVQGLTGGLIQMINHGLSTGALFLLVGML